MFTHATDEPVVISAEVDTTEAQIPWKRIGFFFFFPKHIHTYQRTFLQFFFFLPVMDYFCEKLIT